MSKSGGGWINNNYIHVGNMSTLTRDASQMLIWNSSSCGIQMYSYGNANTFSGAIEGYRIGIKVMGVYNRIEGLRLEACSSYTICLEGQETRGNYLYGEYDALLVSKIYAYNLGVPWYKALQIYGVGDYTYLNTLKYVALSKWIDSKLVRDIQPISTALNKVVALDGRIFQMIEKEDDDSTKTKFNYGFHAQDVQKVLPELVDVSNEMYSIEYDGFIPILVEAIKELKEINNTQQKEIELLNQKIKRLELLLKVPSTN
jgi:hypothetical protein